MPTDPAPNSSAAQPPEITDTEVAAQLKERFKALPKVVQDAITSADVQKQMRAVSDNHKLHLDQWGALENEVMMTLLGFQEPSALASNIQSEVGVSAEEAAALAGDVNKIVFEPIRQALERGLEHPEAKEKEFTPAEAARNTILADAASAAAAVPTASSQPLLPVQPVLPVPATPPAPAPTAKAERAPISSSYSSRQASSARKDVEGDPYRELPQ